ncbi:MAG: PIG-L family deacetylase [Chloroflexota bacterium]
MKTDLTLLAVHAHPDDEAIGTGGIMARYAEEGIRVVLACGTRGEAGEIVDPTMDEREVRPRLGQVREAELRCACERLGVSDLFFLDYRDSGMMGTDDNDNPASFWRANLDEATKRLVKVVRTVRPQVMVTYDERGGYGHPDHIMAHRVAVAAFDAASDPARFPDLELPAWQPSKLYFTAIPRSFFHLVAEYFQQSEQASPFEGREFDPEIMGTPDEKITARLDVRPYMAQKRGALECHRSQIQPESFFFMLDGLAESGLGYECFVIARSHLSVSPPEDDLFAGLRPG